MGIRDMFRSLPPKLTSKIISGILAFTITAAGFTCVEALFGRESQNDSEEPSVENETLSGGTEEKVENKAVFDAEGAMSLGSAVNGLSGVFCSLSERKILAEKNMETRINAGELSAFVTAIVVSRAVESGKIVFEDMAVCPASAAKSENYALSSDVFSIGKRMKIADILKCMMYQRGSSYAYTLAVHISGSEEEFVKEMNSLCAELGLKGTAFNSVCGGENSSGYTTSYDIAVIMKTFLEDNRLREIFLSREPVTIDRGYSESVCLVVKNDFFEKYCTESQSKNDGLIGGKSGYVGYSGWAIAVFERNGKEYVSVVTESGTAFSDILIMYSAFM